MKIISKYKDYYDYLVGEYGYDTTVVYDRRVLPMFKYEEHGEYEIKYSDPVDSYIFHICNRRLLIYEYDNQFYHGIEQIKELNALLKEDGFEKYQKLESSRWWSTEYLKQKYYDKESEMNKKYRQPVLIEYPSGNFMIPLLLSFNFHRIFDADTMYKKVYAFVSWLKDNPPPPDNQTNEEKIVSHGFDKKISFRHRK